MFHLHLRTLYPPHHPKPSIPNILCWFNPSGVQQKLHCPAKLQRLQREDTLGVRLVLCLCLLCPSHSVWYSSPQQYLSSCQSVCSKSVNAILASSIHLILGSMHSPDWINPKMSNPLSFSHPPPTFLVLHVYEMPPLSSSLSACACPQYACSSSWS
jgi:hypothetical protein